MPVSTQQPVAADRVPLTRSERARIAIDLRLACMRISRRVRFESTDEVAPHQLTALVRVEKGPCTPRELAQHERVSPPSMTRTVSSLTNAGWVQRANDPHDGRRVILSLTPAGAQVLAQVRERRDAWMAVRLAGLSDPEVLVLAQASAILGRIASE